MKLFKMPYFAILPGLMLVACEDEVTAPEAAARSVGTDYVFSHADDPFNN